MKTRKERWAKIPTQVEIDAFDGGSSPTKYREAVRSGWCCPCCKRTAHELIRWTILSPRRSRIWGWTTGLIGEHHCHNYDYRTKDATKCRFEPTVICGDCNSADGTVKARFGLPENFTFSPDEIAQFVRCVPHSGKTEIDYQKAYDLYLRRGGRK